MTLLFTQLNRGMNLKNILKKSIFYDLFLKGFALRLKTADEE